MIDYLRETLAVTRAIQNVSLIQRGNELPVAMNALTDISYQQIRNFFQDSIDNKQDLKTVFEKRFGLPVDFVKQINCELDDNKAYWQGFIDDLSGEHSVDRAILAYAVLATLASINDPNETVEYCDCEDVYKAENLRLLDILNYFYTAEIKSGEDGAIEFITIDDEMARDNVIHEIFAFDRDFKSYQTQYCPDILFKLGDFLSTCFKGGVAKIIGVHLDGNSEDRKLTDEAHTNSGANVIQFTPRVGPR